MKCFDSKYFKVFANKKRRDFTICEYDEDGKLESKLRTEKQSAEDFRYYSQCATRRDWDLFLEEERDNCEDIFPYDFSFDDDDLDEMIDEL